MIGFWGDVSILCGDFRPEMKVTFFILHPVEYSKNDILSNILMKMTY